MSVVYIYIYIYIYIYPLYRIVLSVYFISYQQRIPAVLETFVSFLESVSVSSSKSNDTEVWVLGIAGILFRCIKLSSIVLQWRIVRCWAFKTALIHEATFRKNFIQDISIPPTYYLSHIVKQNCRFGNNKIWVRHQKIVKKLNLGKFCWFTR